MPGFAHLNEGLQDRTPGRTTFQTVFRTDDEFYTWLKSHHLEKDSFHHFMEELMSNLSVWLDVVDFPREFGAGLMSTDGAFVDVGGGIGQQRETLKSRYPELQGSAVLQDKPDVVAGALSLPDMEATGYGYLTEQPVKGNNALFNIGEIDILITHELRYRRTCVLFPPDHAQQRRPDMYQGSAVHHSSHERPKCTYHR